jgi:hypothetical protein
MAAVQCGGHTPTPDRIIALGHAHRNAKALLSAVELGVFTALASGPLDVHALTRAVGIAQRGARDFFDALVALGMLARDDIGRYANTPETAQYLDRSKPDYLGGELEFVNAQLYGRWDRLTAALRSGEPQTDTGSAGHYVERYADPNARDAFARAMTAATKPIAVALAAQFPWKERRSVVDIGTAQGCLVVEIAKVHSHLRGIGFDLAPLRPAFDQYVDAYHLSDRLRFVAGDFLKEPLPAGDVLVLGRVLHNWDLPTKLMLLAKAYDALPSGGAIIVYERLIDDARRVNSAALLSSLNMLLMTSGGFDFSAADCIGWMQQVGFRAHRAEPLPSRHAMIIATK